LLTFNLLPYFLYTVVPCTNTGPNIVGNVLVHETATIGKDCKIGPDVVGFLPPPPSTDPPPLPGKGCKIGSDVIGFDFAII